MSAFIAESDLETFEGWIRYQGVDSAVMVPRDSEWDPHTSYHLDGTVHAKNYGEKFSSIQKRQPLTDAFRGHESLGRYAGYGPRSVGAVAETVAFSEVVRVPPNVLGPRHGNIDIDLVEPDTPEHPKFCG